MSELDWFVGVDWGPRHGSSRRPQRVKRHGQFAPDCLAQLRFAVVPLEDVELRDQPLKPVLAQPQRAHPGRAAVP